MAGEQRGLELGALALIVLGAVALVPGVAGAAPNFCVNPGGTGGCLSSIQAAVDASKPGTIITVEAGTYAETVVAANPTRLTIVGAGSATTVIDGGGTGVVFDLAGERSTLVMSHVTLRNGNNVSTPFAAGGLRAASNARVFLAGVVVEDNHGSGIGFDNRGTLTAAEVELRDNTVSGISGDFVKVTLSSVTASGNQGNGIVLQGGKINITGSSFSGNAGIGAFIRSGGTSSSVRAATAVITESEFVGNGTAGNGSGIVYSGKPNGGGKLLLQRSVVSGNTALYGGGGITMGWGRVTIDASTISGNTAPEGGGLYLEHLGAVGRLLITRSTISGNTAETGGGVWLKSGSPTAVRITNSTIAANVATSAGGGIWMWDDFGIGIEATILADNQAPVGPDCLDELKSFGWTLLESSAGCVLVPGTGDVVGVDPQLGPLTNNGGLTETHAIADTSPASGVVTTAKLCKQTDQRNLPRFAPCDIGAYEDL
jgi:hypothetical protein